MGRKFLKIGIIVLPLFVTVIVFFAIMYRTTRPLIEEQEASQQEVSTFVEDNEENYVEEDDVNNWKEKWQQGIPITDPTTRLLPTLMYSIDSGTVAITLEPDYDSSTIELYKHSSSEVLRTIYLTQTEKPTIDLVIDEPVFIKVSQPCELDILSED